MKKAICYAFVAISALLIFRLSFAYTNYLDTQLKSDMQWALKKYHLSGISLSYTLGGASDIKTLTAGYSDIKNNIPITSDTYFEVGSVTKAFISSIIMQQVTKGKITLDQSLKQIAERYPGKNEKLFKVVKKYPHLGKITLRQYLTHTSGIADSINTETFMNAFSQNPLGYWSSLDLIDITMSQDPYFEPGEGDYYGYTNTDYIIAGLVIESLTGKSIVDGIQEFMSGLGLNGIYFPSPHAKNIPHTVLNGLSRAYITKEDQVYTLAAFSGSPRISFPDGMEAIDITPIALNYSAIGPASGGLIAKTSDLAQWYWLLFHNKVISKPLFDEMLKGVPTADKDKKYGLAIVVQKTRDYGVIYSHDGDVFGYSANLLYVPKLNLILSVSVNTSTNAISSTTTDIVGKFLKTFLENKAD